MQWTKRGEPPVGFKHQYFPTLNSIATERNRQREGPPANFKHRYFPTLNSIATERNQQREGPPANFKHQYFPTLNSIVTERNWQKGEGPQPASSIVFSDTWKHHHWTQSMESGWPPGILKHHHFPRWWLRTRSASSFKSSYAGGFCHYCKFIWSLSWSYWRFISLYFCRLLESVG